MIPSARGKVSSIRLGLAEIAITDHVDYGIKYDWSEIDQMPYRQNEADFPSALISIVLRYQVQESLFCFSIFSQILAAWATEAESLSVFSLACMKYVWYENNIRG